MVLKVISIISWFIMIINWHNLFLFFFVFWFLSLLLLRKRKIFLQFVLMVKIVILMSYWKSISGFNVICRVLLKGGHSFVDDHDWIDIVYSLGFNSSNQRYIDLFKRFYTTEFIPFEKWYPFCNCWCVILYHTLFKKLIPYAGKKAMQGKIEEELKHETWFFKLFFKWINSRIHQVMESLVYVLHHLQIQ